MIILLPGFRRFLSFSGMLEPFPVLTLALLFDDIDVLPLAELTEFRVGQKLVDQRLLSVFLGNAVRIIVNRRIDNVPNLKRSVAKEKGTTSVVHSEAKHARFY